MKRIISLIVTAVLFAFLLFSCAEKGEATLIGTWSLTAQFDNAPVSVSVTFDEDGKGSYTIENYMSDAFTYTVNEKSVMITVYGRDEAEIPYVLSDDTLTLTYGGADLIFSRISNDLSE